MIYYLFINGQQVGPYSEEQLKGFVETGKVQVTDLAWRDGLAEWVPLSTILSGTAVGAPPAARPGPAARAVEPDDDDDEEEGMSTTRKWLLGLGALAIVGVLALGSAIAVLFWQGGKMDASSKAYVDNYMSTIAPGWSSGDFLNRVSPQFRDQFKRQTVDALFNRLSTLGNLTHYEGSTGDAHISIRSLGKTVTANYVARGTFEHGDATFSIMLMRLDSQWTIIGLRVDSPVLHR